MLSFVAPGRRMSYLASGASAWPQQVGAVSLSWLQVNAHHILLSGAKAPFAELHFAQHAWHSQQLKRLQRFGHSHYLVPAQNMLKLSCQQAHPFLFPGQLSLPTMDMFIDEQTRHSMHWHLAGV